MGGKEFRLKDGSRGTKREAIEEAIRAKKIQMLKLEEELADLFRLLEGERA